MFTPVKKLIGALSLGAVLLAGAVPVYAADISPADLDAAVRTFGFVDTLQRRSPIAVSVVYRPGDAESKNAALHAATALTGIPMPHAASIIATAVAGNELGQGGHHVDVLYIIPGSIDYTRAVGEFARRQRVLSISNDPSCLAAQCCALMVRAGARTEIVLDTALAREIGATFSTVFLMMVKRR